MVIQKLKKVKMQVVKSIIVFLVLFTSINSLGQNLSGEYVITNTVGSGIGMEILFLKNENFQQTYFFDSNRKEIFKGKYSVSNDTLTLSYDDIRTVKDVEYLSRTKFFDDQFSVDIQVTDEDGKPVKEMMFYMANENHRPVVSLDADEAGNIPKFYVVDDYIRTLVFSFVGKTDVTIPADSLLGYHNTIRVVLQDATTVYSFKSPEKYLILSQTENTLKLILLEADQIPLILTKK